MAQPKRQDPPPRTGQPIIREPGLLPQNNSSQQNNIKKNKP